MGVLDSIKGLFGGGSETSRPPENRMRQPPGRESPPGDPGPGPAMDSGRGSGDRAPSGGPESSRGSAPPETRGGGRSPEPPRSETPSDEGPAPRREDRGSTLDVDREPSSPPTSGQGSNEDLDFETVGGSQGTSERDSNPSPPTPPTERREERDRGLDRRDERGRDESTGSEIPDQPGDYNLDLPEPREGEDRIDRIEEQNQRIIDLLEDIRDRMGREGGRR